VRKIEFGIWIQRLLFVFTNLKYRKVDKNKSFRRYIDLAAGRGHRPGPAYRIQTREVGAWAMRGPSGCRVRRSGRGPDRPQMDRSRRRFVRSRPVKLRAATITIWCAQVASISAAAPPPVCRDSLQFPQKSSESERVFIHTHRFTILGVRIAFRGSKSFPRRAWPRSSLAFIRYSVGFSNDLRVFWEYS